MCFKPFNTYVAFPVGQLKVSFELYYYQCSTLIIIFNMSVWNTDNNVQLLDLFSS